MDNTNFTQERESDQDVSVDETEEGSYENYRRKNLPEGYTPYRDTRQVNEFIYDRCDSVYSTCERPVTGTKSCCKIDWLFNISKSHKMLKTLVEVGHLPGTHGPSGPPITRSPEINFQNVLDPRGLTFQFVDPRHLHRRTH